MPLTCINLGNASLAQSNKLHAKIFLDKTLLFCMLAILAFGLVMVESSSMITAQHGYANGFYFFIKQLIFAIFALGVSTVILFIPTKLWQKLGPFWLAIAFILLVLVLVPGIGRVVNGSRRWISLGPIALQVSELVKLCGVMFMANYLVKHGDSARASVIGVAKPIGVLILMAGLLLLEPDFGATFVLFVTALGMMFLAGVRLRWFIMLVLLGTVAVVFLIVFSPYRLARLTGFLHPWVNQYSSGYQLTQSLIAFGRGGTFGVGLGHSIQKLFYLPEAHTDFVLAIIAEELGLIGVLILLALFSVLVWRGLKIAKQANINGQMFDSYLAYGITFWLGMQVIINFGVNVGLLPTKGLTLPLVSYGGSSLVVDSVIIAMLLRIDFQNKIFALLGVDN